ncbi:ribonuclease H2 subunit C [Pleurodeles waltl]|uniref:ribonuclease H2 subunit C n=1 Tax=Pleurodeles waltl TaxID=8319 RepID=UPI003709BDE3
MSESGSVPHSVIRIDLSSLQEASQDPMHLLPCEIEYDGSAGVENYFTPAIRQRPTEKVVSFRGRCLRGQEVALPDGYVGMVLKEDHKPCSEEDDRCVRVKSTFRAFMSWNLETPPSSDDSVLMSIMWPKIAEAIHAPVDEE